MTEKKYESRNAGNFCDAYTFLSRTQDIRLCRDVALFTNPQRLVEKTTYNHLVERVEHGQRYNKILTSSHFLFATVVEVSLGLATADVSE
jgi:hypothetical protein